MELGTLAGGASLVPAAVGWTCRHALGWRREVALWVVVLAVQNVVLRILSWENIPTWPVTWWAYPITFVLGVRAILSFPSMVAHRSHFWPLVLGFLGAWVVAPFLGDRQDGYSLVLAPLHALLLAAGGGWLLLRAVGADLGLEAPPVLVGTATLLTYGPFALVWPASAILGTAAPEWVLPMWETRAGLLLAGSIIFAAALRCRDPA